jgi:FimV-like protein
MAETVFPSKDLAKLSFDFVAVIGHGSPDHGEGDFVVKGEKKHLCNIYDLPDCKAHEAMAAALQRKGLLKDVRGTPTHIIYNPHDLTEISRAHYMAVSQIEDAIAEAQKVLGKPVRWREYEKMRTTLDTARGLIQEKDYRKALKELKDFDAAGMDNLEAEAKALNEQIVEAGHALLDEAKALIESGDHKKAKDLLRDVKRDFAKTDVEDEAKTLFDSIQD